jgi:hypothetical protein
VRAFSWGAYDKVLFKRMDGPVLVNGIEKAQPAVSVI